MATEDDIKQVWETGSYSEVADRYLPMAGQLVDSAGVSSGDRVLDVGCGTGNVAITASRSGAAVTGLDITPKMLEQARRNAETADAEGIDWQEGNATDLPFEANRFDVVLSNLGHMYADPPERAGRELLRVSRPDGVVAFTSWTPTSLFPLIGGLVLTYLPPRDHPEFTEPPFMWGDPNVVEQRLGEHVNTLTCDTRTLQYPALSPSHFWQDLTENSGMFIRFLDKIDERSSLREEVIETIESHFDGRENAVELEYLLTTASVTHSM